MSARRHQSHFWKKWREAWGEVETDELRAEPDYRSAWRRHFADFLGTSPEKHWIFGGRRFRHWSSGKWSPGMFNPFVAVMLSKGGGLLSLFVLHLLVEKPRYGNDIMREIEDRTKGRWGANPGAVYPLLSIMEERGFIEGKWEDPEKRTRRVYRLTANGQVEYDRLKEVMRPKLEEAINVMRDLFADMEMDQEG